MQGTTLLNISECRVIGLRGAYSATFRVTVRLRQNVGCVHHLLLNVAHYTFASRVEMHRILPRMINNQVVANEMRIRVTSGLGSTHFLIHFYQLSIYMQVSLILKKPKYGFGKIWWVVQVQMVPSILQNPVVCQISFASLLQQLVDLLRHLKSRLLIHPVLVSV